MDRNKKCVAKGSVSSHLGVWSGIAVIMAFVCLFCSGCTLRFFIRQPSDYTAALRKAIDAEKVVLPADASKRTTPDLDRKTRLFVNIDETTQIPDYVAYLETKSEITDDDLYYYVEPYFNTQVTDILFSIFGQTSVTPTDVMTWRGEKVKWTTENGPAEVDYSNVRWWWYNLQEKGIDPVPYWIEACRKNDINP